MDISKDEYDFIIKLLKSGERAEASKLLIHLTRASKEDAKSILDDIMTQENIEVAPVSSSPPPPSITSTPPTPTPTRPPSIPSIPTPPSINPSPPAPSIASSTPPPPSIKSSPPAPSTASSPPPPSSVKSSPPAPAFTQTPEAQEPPVKKILLPIAPMEEEVGEEKNSIMHHIISALAAPLVVVSIIGGILAVIAYFISKATLKNKEFGPVPKYFIVGASLAIPYIVYFVFLHTYTSPFMADRTSVVDLPRYLVPAESDSTSLPLDVEFIVDENGMKITGGESNSFDGAGGSVEIVTADADLSYDKNDVNLKIIAIGIHESSIRDTNLTYYDPITKEKLEYPFDHEGDEIMFEDVIKEERERSALDIKDNSKVPRSFQSSRMLRFVYTCNDDYYIKNVTVVERETNRLVTNTEYRKRSKHRSHFAKKIDMVCHTWHSAKWDLYVEVYRKQKYKRTTKTTLVPMQRGTYPLVDGVVIQVAGVYDSGGHKEQIEKDTYYPLMAVNYHKKKAVVRVLPASAALYTDLYSGVSAEDRDTQYGKVSDWVSITIAHLLDKSGNFKFDINVPSKVVKFELPRIEGFDVDPDEKNLFDIVIPYYKLDLPFLKTKESYQNKNHYLADLNKAGRFIIEAVAEMVQYEVDPNVYNMALKGKNPERFENVTPYEILKEYADNAGLEIVVDEKNRILSFKYK